MVKSGITVHIFGQSMDFDAISVFVKVVETGGFSAAARVLGMPKTTVSAKVAVLEKRLGVDLIQRTTRKLRVTEAGEKYFHHCANAVREVELAEAALRSVQDKPSGLLRITAPVDISHTILPRIAHAYAEQHAGTRVEMVITNRFVDLLGEGFDLAIRTGAMKDSSLMAKRFFDVHIGLWASPKYLERTEPIIHPRQLADARFVGGPGGRAPRLVKGKQEIEVPILNRVFTNDLETVKELTLLGEGWGALPDFLVVDEVRDGTLVSVLPEWEVQSVGAFYFVYASHKYTSPKVQAFIQTALRMAPLSLSQSFMMQSQKADRAET
jgi:DNA-binding transcriptional LysR family regulator